MIRMRSESIMSTKLIAEHIKQDNVDTEGGIRWLPEGRSRDLEGLKTRGESW
jgi:hypothetical protein